MMNKEIKGFSFDVDDFGNNYVSECGTIKCEQYIDAVLFDNDNQFSDFLTMDKAQLVALLQRSNIEKEIGDVMPKYVSRSIPLAIPYDATLDELVEEWQADGEAASFRINTIIESNADTLDIIGINANVMFYVSDRAGSLPNCIAESPIPLTQDEQSAMLRDFNDFLLADCGKSLDELVKEIANKQKELTEQER